MLRYIHGSTFYLFFVLPKMEAPNFESIFECMGSIKFLFLFLFLFFSAITESDVIKAIDKLPSKTCSGVDGISPVLLKHIKHVNQ